jgi:hypothetical protein
MLRVFLHLMDLRTELASSEAVSAPVRTCLQTPQAIQLMIVIRRDTYSGADVFSALPRCT